jgi:hypothetical protein
MDRRKDARLGRRASRRAAESRGRARLGSTGRVSALEGAEALLERISLATHTRIRHTGAVVGSEDAGRVGAVYSNQPAFITALWFEIIRTQLT